MLIVAALALGVLLVPVCGGDLRRIAGARLRWPALLLLALALQTGALYLPLPHWTAAAMHLASYAVIFAFLALNIRVPGLWLVAAGTAVNFTAIAVNAGTMPAAAGALRLAGLDAGVGHAFVNSALGAHARLAFLGDVFAVPASFPLANVFSIGDVLIVAGACYAVHRLAGSRLVTRGRRATARG